MTQIYFYMISKSLKGFYIIDLRGYVLTLECRQTYTFLMRLSMKSVGPITEVIFFTLQQTIS